MPTPETLFLEFDKTGQSQINYIFNERHVTGSTNTRLIIPNFGAFYKHTLRVFSFDPQTNQNVALTNEVDYLATEMLHHETAKVGKEICSVVLIINPGTSTVFSINYQALGGHNNINRDNLKTQLDKIQNPTQQFSWDSILSKPKGYTPGDHLHDSQDLYGLEYIADAVNRLEPAIRTGNEGVNNALFDIIDDEVEKLKPLGDNIVDTVDSVMVLEKSAHETIVTIHEKQIKLSDHLKNLVDYTKKLKNDILDYKRLYGNGKFSNVLNLLCHKKYTSNNTIIDVPELIGGLEIYLDSQEYDDVNNRWVDHVDSSKVYAAPSTTNKPIKTTSSTNPSIDVVRFTSNKILEKISGHDTKLTNNRTIITVMSPVETTKHLKMDLFTGDGKKMVIDTSNKIAYRYCNIDESEAVYDARTSDVLDTKAFVSIATIADREIDCIYLNNSPYRRGLTATGVMSDSLNTESINSSIGTIGSLENDQSADIMLILVYNRVLSNCEIHAILTYIKLKYNTTVQYIENANFTNFDIGHSSDLENNIDFNNRGTSGTIAVTDRPISIWDSANTYTQPGYDTSSSIKIDNNPYLLVLSKNKDKAFWRQIINLDPHIRYEFKISLVYGQVNPPSIVFKINDEIVAPEIILASNQSILRNYVIAFRPKTIVNKMELFNLNESMTGNCFGIGPISLERKIYSD